MYIAPSDGRRRPWARPRLGGLEATLGFVSFSFKFSSMGSRLTSPAEGGSFQSSPSSQLARQVLSTHLHHPARPSYRCRTHLMAEEWNPIQDSAQINQFIETHREQPTCPGGSLSFTVSLYLILFSPCGYYVWQGSEQRSQILEMWNWTHLYPGATAS